MNTVLIVEDEQPIRQMVSFAMAQEGYQFLEAEDTSTAQKIIGDQVPDMILMDWMLPDISGLELTKRLKRQAHTRHIPIIMLTARSDQYDKIAGLNAGADDYLSKPFSTGELVARMQAVWRRSAPENNQEVIQYQDLQLDPNSHRVVVNKQALDLGPTEFRLLKFFMENPNRVYSREQLLDNAWGRHVYVEERTVDVHILRLRKALTPWGYDEWIQTVRGAGYRFSTQA